MLFLLYLCKAKNSKIWCSPRGPRPRALNKIIMYEQKYFDFTSPYSSVPLLESKRGSEGRGISNQITFDHALYTFFIRYVLCQVMHWCKSVVQCTCRVLHYASMVYRTLLMYTVRVKMYNKANINPFFLNSYCTF